MLNKETYKQIIEKSLIEKGYLPNPSFEEKLDSMINESFEKINSKSALEIIEKCGGKGTKSYIAHQLSKHRDKLETLLQELVPLSDDVLEWVGKHDKGSGFEFPDDTERWGYSEEDPYTGRNMQERELQFVKEYVEGRNDDFQRLSYDVNYMNDHIDVFKKGDWDSDDGKEFLDVYMDYHSLQIMLSNGGMYSMIESRKDAFDYLLKFSDDPNFDNNPYFNHMTKIFNFNIKSLNYNTEDMEKHMPLTDDDLHRLIVDDDDFIGTSDE